MNNHGSLILALLVCAALAIAGCTTTDTSAPATPVPAATATYSPATSLSSLSLDRTDLPEGYVLTVTRQKNATEMGSLAKTLGWRAGYVVEYTDTKEVPGKSPFVVLQSLATYPESNMPDIIEYINRTDRSYSDLVYTDLRLSGLGENYRGFAAGVRNPGLPPAVTTASGTSVPLSATGLTIENADQNTLGQDFVEIVFSKGTTLEVIRMSGPVVDDKAAIAIAQKAYQKIP
ncbi:MAG: hypothetical protein M0R30_09575 [Methanoregula sp.]|jgi:hypothetical protein|uniref:hypothetical protein n=1 Tax=Methanoregula sp. TaxID=2052170 RepID=UPI0025CF6868|nr:hypothetical protein [Methanoregula sp.]MCK9631880.1 hypothetical protein [Methanoregula sp.]